ncbi:hypothetical protein [Actinoplanes subtropicus]|uniref:hypothetical protein n=1 Tax=Actinoplanes subtropicus TaxID=543632 RepID=UPI0012F8CF53|nr:hypothetical protein [Actinoplanes subtropicus]
MPIRGPEVFEARRRRAAGTIAAVMAVWLLAVPFLAVAAFFTGFTLPRAAPIAAGRQAEAGRLILALAVVLVLLPGAATVIGARYRRPIIAGLCGLITVVGLAAALLLVPAGMADLGWKATPARIPAPPTPSRCIERSGGDTRCPGG